MHFSRTDFVSQNIKVCSCMPFIAEKIKLIEFHNFTVGTFEYLAFKPKMLISGVPLCGWLINTYVIWLSLHFIEILKTSHIS